jgi:hypothetical protein
MAGFEPGRLLAEPEGAMAGFEFGRLPVEPEGAMAGFESSALSRFAVAWCRSRRKSQSPRAA